MGGLETGRADHKQNVRAGWPEVSLDVLTLPEFVKRTYHPNLTKPPEKQDWDIAFWYLADWFGHTGTTFLTYGLLEDSHYRWIVYDPIFEEDWKDMARTKDRETQEEKIRKLVRYVYDRAYHLFIYSPLTLYAVNKEVNFIPYQKLHLPLKETSVTDNHWSVRERK
jgi:hypothetical protein